MMKTQIKPRQVGEFEWTGTILGIAILFGTFVRVLPVFLAGFPINDGGMFLVMMRDLRGNGFALPMYTTYNYMDIPYAYPPLGFYLGAFLELTGISATADIDLAADSFYSFNHPVVLFAGKGN